MVKATLPPLLAAPLTTRKALLSCVVLLVHPVGAAVCTNIIAVPAAKPPPPAVCQEGAEPEPLEVNT